MDIGVALEYGTVGILTVLLVQFGKSVLPNSFRSDNNVWWSAIIAIVLNALYTYMTDGDGLAVWNSVPIGASVGFAVSGLYRGISGAAKKNSIDLDTIAMVGGGGEDAEDDEKAPIGFKTK